MVEMGATAPDAMRCAPITGGIPSGHRVFAITCIRDLSLPCASAALLDFSVCSAPTSAEAVPLPFCVCKAPFDERSWCVTCWARTAHRSHRHQCAKLSSTASCPIQNRLAKLDREEQQSLVHICTLLGEDCTCTVQAL